MKSILSSVKCPVLSGTTYAQRASIILRREFRLRDSGKETHQRRTEKSNVHQQGPVTSVPSPVSCDRIPLLIGDRGQRCASARTAPTHTSLKKESKVSKSYKKDLVKVKRLTTRKCDIKCNCNGCIAFLQSASLIGRLFETKQGRGDLIRIMQGIKIKALLSQLNSLFDY